MSIRVGKGSKEVKATMLSGHWPSTHCREATWEALKCTPQRGHTDISFMATRESYEIAFPRHFKEEEKTESQ